ncbi:beta-propeller fold lactonase family protein [Bradyrhizobium sp. AS23.2]|uniref:beta-propeller fold lactonase family protein n=1 Tax=Bradyrhizobium sp. AS23.2 TaxID=1680155 RepID=UPI00093A598B|nr:beta-propeller fold lactonase family protein [Bradyrhizobium sp. AS23.2]OKO67446.1 hypothetical protein AC630_40310 [Bradyrhizobium sp. AS23.2]
MKVRERFGGASLALAAGAALMLATGSPGSAEAQGERVIGYVYTTTNGEGINEVVRLARYANGMLGDEKTYSTYVRGAANHTAPAMGDYDAQGQTQIVGNVLLTANPASHSISVFKIDRPTGELTLTGNVNSYGDMPVSVTATPISGEVGQYWVVVGNQWGQPTVIYGGDKLQRLPSDAFLRQDLTKADASDKARTIELYRLDGANGTMTHVRTLDHYPRENGGVAQVSFSPDGRKLAVSTWGVPHFLTEDPKLEEMHPSRVYMYDFSGGQVSHRRFFEEAGIAGTVGFEWGPRAERLYVSNFSITNAKGDNGLTVLRDGGARLTKVENYPTGQTNPKDIDEACWTVLSPKGDMLYVVSYVTNVITPFKLDPVSGKVLRRLPLITRGAGYAPSSDSKDVIISKDGKHMYWLGSFQSFSINLYDLGPDGSASYKGQYSPEATKAAVGQAGVYDLGGIAQYDLTAEQVHPAAKSSRPKTR